MAEKKLRVGILCDGLVFQRWQAECIRQVLALDGVKPVVLVVNDRPAADRPSFSERMRKQPWRIAFYLRYRRKRFNPRAMEPEDLSNTLGHLPRILCKTTKLGHGDYFQPADLNALRDLDIDVLLRFGFNIIRGEILELPRYGVWSYHHGDEQKYRGGPPGFWEIMNDDPITGAILQRLTDTLDGGFVLRKGWFKTIDHSLRETVDTVLMHSAPWAAHVCREILAGREEAATGTLSDTKAVIHKYPDNATFLAFLSKQASNKMRFHQRELKEHEEWNIGVLYQPIQNLLEERPSLNARWLPSPSKGQYRADPFGYITDGQLNVLYEKYDYKKASGEINRLRPKRDNVLKRSRTLLGGGSHLSYPYVIERDGQVFVVPENAAKGCVELYRMNAANDSLDHVRTLLDEPLLDPTVFEHQGRWWLFGTKAPLTNVELFAYHSDRFEGPYAPHASNPIKSDIRSSRPGGTPFTHNGELYRPAQDSSLTYGGRIAINRILELSPFAFREEIVKYIGPFKGTAYSQGMHTLSAVGNITLVDGKRHVKVKAQSERVRGRKLGKLGNLKPGNADKGMAAEDSDEDDD